MRAVIGSTFLIATLAGPFVAQAGAILHVTPGQSTGSGLPCSDTDGLAEATPGLAYLDIPVGSCDLMLASALVPTAGASETRYTTHPPRLAQTAVPKHPMIAGGLVSFSAVLAGIHRRHPAILRL